MADFAPIRTGQLVVRRYQPSWRRYAVVIGGVLLGVILLYTTYEWGRFEGGYSKFAEMQKRRELASQIDALERENDRLRAQAAAAELAREVDRKAYADVEKDLAELQAQVLKHREELTFYRGIVSPEDGIGGLRIQRFNVSQGDEPRRFLLRLMLVQSMRQDAVVSGSVLFKVEGVRAQRRVELPLEQLAQGVADEGATAFRFRYFQELQQEIALPADFEPRAVTVEVRSGRLAPVRQSYPWQVVAGG